MILHVLLSLGWRSAKSFVLCFENHVLHVLFSGTAQHLESKTWFDHQHRHRGSADRNWIWNMQWNLVRWDYVTTHCHHSCHHSFQEPPKVSLVLRPWFLSNSRTKLKSTFSFNKVPSTSLRANGPFAWAMQKNSPSACEHLSLWQRAKLVLFAAADLDSNLDEAGNWWQLTVGIEDGSWFGSKVWWKEWKVKQKIEVFPIHIPEEKRKYSIDYRSIICIYIHNIRVLWVFEWWIFL